MKNRLKKSKPPKLAKWLLQRFFPRYLNTSAIDDYKQMFEYLAEKESVRKAYRWYWIQTFKTLPIYIFESFRWSIIMYKNYLKIAFRNIIRHKLYAGISVIGLAIGIACATIILIYVHDESGYDAYHTNKDNIYRVSIELGMARTGKDAHTPSMWGKQLKNDYPEVEDFVRLRTKIEDAVFVFGDTEFNASNMFYADASIFSIFSWPLLIGDPETALRKPQSVVISEKVAKKFFGDTSPYGRMLELKPGSSARGTRTPSGMYEITGIMKDLPKKSHLNADILLPFSVLEQIPVWNRFFGFNPPQIALSKQDGWRGRMVYTYITLKNETDPATVETKFPTFLKNYPIDSETIIRGYRYFPFLQKISDIHLTPNFRNEPSPTGNKNSLYISLIIAILMLLIAGANFTNLTIARSMPRSKEIGVRKVIGARRTQLLRQLLGESLFLSSIASVLAVIMTTIAMPSFYNYLNKELVIENIDIPTIGLSIAAIAFCTGLLAGIYPAFFIAAFKPITALRNTFENGTRNLLIRRGLIVMQFSISIILVIAAFTIFNQLEFMKNYDLGFNKEQVVVIPPSSASALRTTVESFKSELQKNPNISFIATSTYAPGDLGFGGLHVEENKPGDTAIDMTVMMTDIDFVDLYNLELVAGRNFSAKVATDMMGIKSTLSAVKGGSSIIINEEAVRQFGWNSPEEAVGKRLVSDAVDKDHTLTVIGVVKNFNFDSLREDVKPLAIRIAPNFNFISIKLKSTNISETLEYIKTIYHKIAPNEVFSYHFVDENNEELYESEKTAGQIFSYVSMLAILIACMGLFGLASFTVQARVKEIGIRKVLGASIGSITVILSKEYVTLTIIASAISWPIAHEAMDRFLNKFAYRVEQDWTLFIAAGIIGLMVALITVSMHTVRAATANPVKALRSE